MPPNPEPGLCLDCVFHRIVTTARGARFWLCSRARFDDRFQRYPRLPVLACFGYRPETDPVAPQVRADLLQGSEEP
jgi:hypothetical protein